MKYWFIFCKTDIVLEKREDGTYTIPCSEECPIETKPWTHILNITPMEDGTEAKTFTIPEPITDNPKYEMCGLRPSFYKLSPALYQKAGKCQELNYWDQNTHFCGVCGAPMEMASVRNVPTAANRFGLPSPQPSSYSSTKAMRCFLFMPATSRVISTVS